VDEARDGAAQIEQCVQLHDRSAALIRCPREHRQREIDQRAVERVDRLLQLQPKRVVGIEPTGDLDQRLGEVGIDAPVAYAVGVGQRVACNHTAEPHVIELRTLSPQADLHLAQTLPIGQLCERHAQELVEATEPLDLMLTVVPRDAPAKPMQRQMIHDLGEHQLAGVHALPPRDLARETSACVTGGSSR
jgi:hypothetical protein